MEYYLSFKTDLVKLKLKTFSYNILLSPVYSFMFSSIMFCFLAYKMCIKLKGH